MDFDAVDDLEQAYLRALEATEAIEEDLALTLPPESPDDGLEDRAGAQTVNPGSPQPMESSDFPVTGPSDGDSRDAAEKARTEDASAKSPQLECGAATDSEHHPPDAAVVAAADHAEIPARVTPRQIIEAALFVGGKPLTAKKLCAMLRGEYDLDFIEQTIDDFNSQYTDEARPYEIRLGEGGYRLVLRPEFERIRNRVYGIVPKEVKLSQEVLEVLALVAYRQPVSKEDIEAQGKSNPGGALRQLLRRELISIERGTGGRKDVRYQTTSRFLSLFGLANLDELPQADELSFK